MYSIYFVEGVWLFPPVELVLFELAELLFPVLVVPEDLSALFTLEFSTLLSWLDISDSPSLEADILSERVDSPSEIT